MQEIDTLTFHDAASKWIDSRALYIRPNTLRSYREYLKRLNLHLGDRPLSEITIETIRWYQAMRLKSVCALKVNQEVSGLRMVLGEYRRWAPLGDLYKPLPVPKLKVRRNMTEKEEQRFIAVALASPRRRLAGNCLIVMANTTMGFGELRHLRRADVHLNEETPFVTVNRDGAKNEYRERTIPLNFLARRSMKWIVERWEKVGGSDPDQYILPHHARRSSEEKSQKGHARKTPSFTEPMGQINRAARAIFKEAGLSHFTPYDMRSHAITKILSDPNVSPQVSQEIAGHISVQMQRRYSKQLLTTKQRALDAMCEDVPARHSAAEPTVAFRPQPAPSQCFAGFLISSGNTWGFELNVAVRTCQT